MSTTTTPVRGVFLLRSYFAPTLSSSRTLNVNRASLRIVSNFILDPLFNSQLFLMHHVSSCNIYPFRFNVVAQGLTTWSFLYHLISHPPSPSAFGSSTWNPVLRAHLISKAPRLFGRASREDVCALQPYNSYHLNLYWQELVCSFVSFKSSVFGDLEESGSVLDARERKKS